MTKLEALTKQYHKAVDRMEEVLKQRKSAFMRDAAIKRFEFTFDLAWKLTRAFLEKHKGVTCVSPKECIREGYRQGVIEYDKLWIKMSDWRNEIVHEYSEDFSDELYSKLPKVLKLFQELKDFIDQYKTNS